MHEIACLLSARYLVIAGSVSRCDSCLPDAPSGRLQPQAGSEPADLFLADAVLRRVGHELVAPSSRDASTACCQ